MRPKKTRWIKCDPGERCFRPEGKTSKKMESVTMSLDEFEAIRLSDQEGLTQDRIAEKMRVHRSTVARILQSAHLKVADALVNIKKIKIEGGCCKSEEEKYG